MTYARIIGTGGYLPTQVLRNQDLEKMVDTNHDWIVERTGIHARHIADKDQCTCDLAEQAALQAIQNAGINATDIDLIVLATTTPDRIFPSTASLLQARLGVSHIPAFDVQAVCSGFVYALSVADKFVKSGEAKHALVVGAEIFSRIIDWTDRTTCVLFGDGAGAVVLGADNEPGIHATKLYADGRHADCLTVPGYVAEGQLQGGDGFTHMQGQEVFKFAVSNMRKSAEEMLASQQMTVNDVDWLIPHQANKRIIDSVVKKLGLPPEKVVLTVSEHGNTSAASVPLALNLAVNDGRVKRGDTLLIEAMGGGFTWGAALATF